MFSRIWLINLVLAIGVAVCGVYAYEEWSRGGKTDLPAETEPGAAPGRGNVTRPPRKRIAPESAYDAVVAKNLFSESRTAPEADAEDGDLAEVSVDVSLQEIRLYGVVIADDVRKALVERRSGGASSGQNPFTAARRRKAGQRPRQAEAECDWVREGDLLGVYRVSSIQRDKIVLQEGENAVEVLLYDADNPKERRPVPRPVETRKPPTAPEGKGSQPAPAPQKKDPNQPENPFEAAAKKLPFGLKPGDQEGKPDLEELRRRRLEMLKRAREQR